jgi:hypothetical protein
MAGVSALRRAIAEVKQRWSVVVGGAQWPRGQCARRAIAEVRNIGRSSDG